jgi:hypothetical protein
MSFNAFGQPKKIKCNVRIQFESFVGDAPLHFDSVSYKNVLGQSFTVSKFRYYIGNIHLRGNGKEYVSDKYFLIDEDEPASKSILLNDVPNDVYTSFSFIIGVDSARNCSGVQTGALDPLNGMFWAWNTGYIFLKLEGKSPVSDSPGNMIEYHIGGYKEPANCIRKISLSFSHPLKMMPEEKIFSLIKIKADVAEILKTPNIVDFTKLSSVNDFHNATTIADNYADMFSILKVE